MKVLETNKLKSGSTVVLSEWKSESTNQKFWRIEWESADESSRSSIPYQDYDQAKSTYQNILKY